MLRYLFLTLVAIFVLMGCGGSERAYRTLQADLQTVETKVDKLRGHLQANRLTNAIRLTQYSRKIVEIDPSLKDLANTLALEATPRGLLYKSLVERLGEFKKTSPLQEASRQDISAASTKLSSIFLASQHEEFNRALADPVNVLADLSQGTLPRSDAIPSQSETGVGMEHGTQLVGNPTYGQWQNNSSGRSFWVWYGQYSLLRNVLGGRNYGYSDWSGNRRYSYYHDYGRQNYTSPSQATRHQATENRAKQKFAREGKTFTSPYARTRAGASQQVSRAKTRQSSAAASSRSYKQLSSRSSSRGK